jgi:uncharacterized protein
MSIELTIDATGRTVNWNFKRIARRVGGIAVALIALYFGVGYLATMPVVGNHPYWRRLRAQPSDFGLHAQTVSFPSEDHIPLTAWYIPASPIARGTVIIAHGIDGNRSDMLPRAAVLVPDGYNALLVDLRDHGQSGGNYASPGYVESRDILGAVDYLKSRGASPPFIAMGHSYGAVAVLWAAARSPEIAAVIADSAYISFTDMVRRATFLLADDPTRSFGERLGLRLAGLRGVEEAIVPIYWLRTGIWMSNRKANTLSPIARMGNRPVLFIAGAEDEICPPDNAQKMYNATSSPAKALLIVPGADHASTFSTDPKLYENTVIAFLNRVPR